MCTSQNTVMATIGTTISTTMAMMSATWSSISPSKSEARAGAAASASPAPSRKRMPHRAARRPAPKWDHGPIAQLLRDVAFAAHAFGDELAVFLHAIAFALRHGVEGGLALAADA